MPACPAGHDSSATDFCDVCGMRIGGAAAGSVSQTSGAGPASGGASAAAQAPPGEPCPQCGTERTGQFCEGCGFDFSTGEPAASPADPPASASVWTAVVTADHAYYDRVIAAGGPDAQSIEFPGYCPERRFQLSGKEMRIGRRSASQGLEPEIDLTGPPADPGISHLHAVLIAQPGGGWSVLDPGSSNGTQVNDTDIETGVAVPLNPGDRISIGAWTVLTLQT
jgi:FHA domain-containing protein